MDRLHGAQLLVAEYGFNHEFAIPISGATIAVSILNR